jgi:Ca2+-binding RTX toxin-like protein
MTVFTTTSPINLDSFYSSESVFNPNPVAILAATSTSFWFRLEDGTHLRYTGTGFGYTGFNFSNGFSGLAPAAGTYNKIEVTDAAGNALSTWSGFGDLFASDIVHNTLFGTALGLDVFTLKFLILNGDDTLTGSGGTDTLHGYSGNDTINLTKGLDKLYGDFGDDNFVYQNNLAGNTLGQSFLNGQTIDGGDGFDTLTISTATFTSGAANIDLTNVIFNSVEKIKLSPPSASQTTFLTTINAASIGAGLANNLTVDFANTLERDVKFVVSASTGGTYSLANFIFQNLRDPSSSFANEIQLRSTTPGEAVNWIGSSMKDVFYANNGADSFAGGAGYDWANFDKAGAYTGTYDGGGDHDSFLVGANATTGVFDFTNATITGFYQLAVYNGSVAKVMAAEFIGPDRFSSTNFSDSYSQIDITMGSEYSLDLSYITGGIPAYVPLQNSYTIRGDFSTEFITGSYLGDRIISGGGNDFISGGLGDDTVVISDSLNFTSTLTIDGGSFGLNGYTADTLELTHDALGIINFDLNAHTISNMERIAFGIGVKSASISYANFLLGFSPTTQLTNLDPESTINTFRIDTGAQAVVDLSALTFGDWGAYQTVEIIDQNGFNAAQTFTGTTRNDYIFAGGGNDIVNGGNGDDTLIGDIGADSLFGDAGNDTIYFDAFDLATNVNGGADFDTLVVVNGTLPGSYNLAAGSFEQLDLQQTDIFNNQTWKRIDNYYNLASQLTASSTYYDDNSRITTYFDYNNTNVWITSRNDYNAALQLTQQVLALDTGSFVYESYDVNNTQVWSSLRTDYNAAYQWTQQVLVLDNGTRIYEQFDPEDNEIWSSIRTDYNANLQWTQQVLVLDDGTRIYEEFDPEDNEIWSSLRTDYNAALQWTQQVLVLDTGLRIYELFDPADVQAWSSFRNDYDATFNLLYSKLVDDSGTYDTVDYDVANTQTWNEWHRSYSATNVLLNEYFV